MVKISKSRYKANSFVSTKCCLHLRSSALRWAISKSLCWFLCTVDCAFFVNCILLQFALTCPPESGMRRVGRFPWITILLPLVSGPGNGWMSPLNEVRSSIKLKPAQEFGQYEILCLKYFRRESVNRHIERPHHRRETKGSEVVYWTLTKDGRSQARFPRAKLIHNSSKLQKPP